MKLILKLLLGLLIVFLFSWVVLDYNPFINKKSSSTIGNVLSSVLSSDKDASSNISEEEGEVAMTEEAMHENYLTMFKEAMDVEEEQTRLFALDLAAKYPGNFNIDQICEVYNELYKKWKYVNDPRGREYVAKASTTIKAGLKGDCDDFAILMATMIESIGGEARVVGAYNYEIGGHAYTEVNIGDPSDIPTHLESVNKHYAKFFGKLFGRNKVDSLHYRIDEDGDAWLNLDWTSKYPGGKYFVADETIYYYPLDGDYLIVKNDDNQTSIN